MKKRMSKSVIQNARSVLDMNCSEARAFFLKPESYCNMDLPPYLSFSKLLRSVEKVIKENDCDWKKSQDYEDVNYSLFTNKDGAHAWRPLQLIHPALYVSLVNSITTNENWVFIQDRFKRFQVDKIRCLSIPISSTKSQKNRAAQILQWWETIEQASIALALEYRYVLHADLTDCYGAIYTHSIPWALHGRKESKLRNNRNNMRLIGNVLDKRIQSMRYGQTNGIPQGSVLMDLIAEIVLGDADRMLAEHISESKIEDFQILRYRDDYRIFVNNPRDGDQILKCLTEIMVGINHKLNTAKTSRSQSVISNSLKKDKIAWMRNRQSDDNLQKHLLLIHIHSVEHPNGGSLLKPLSLFYDQIKKLKKIDSPIQLISIAVDIAYASPRTFPICAAIISKILTIIKGTDRAAIVKQIHRKLLELPNMGHMEIWLQRICIPYTYEIDFKERICRLVNESAQSLWNDELKLWNNDWISSEDLKGALDSKQIIVNSKLKTLDKVIQKSEFSVFPYSH